MKHKKSKVAECFLCKELFEYSCQLAVHDITHSQSRDRLMKHIVIMRNQKDGVAECKKVFEHNFQLEKHKQTHKECDKLCDKQHEPMDNNMSKVPLVCKIWSQKYKTS